MRTVSFVVPGLPVSQGSMKPVRRGKHLGVVANNKEALGDYRARVTLAADAEGILPRDGPVSLTVTFVLPRPKGHFGTGRNAGMLKRSAPEHVTVSPDLDKLQRALFDGLHQVALYDDSQIVQVSASKVYVTSLKPRPCTEVAIAYLGERERQLIDG